MSKVGIVVVTHNSEGVIGECLDAALASGAEVAVVDNASQDRTLEEVHQRPEVRLPRTRGSTGSRQPPTRASKHSRIPTCYC